MTDFEALLRGLCAAGVRFIVIGGAAATAHGSARLTNDLDVLYARDAANIGRLVSALSPFQPYLRGAPPGLPFVWEERTVVRGLNFTLDTAAGPLDVFGEISPAVAMRTWLREASPWSSSGRPASASASKRCWSTSAPLGDRRTSKRSQSWS